MSHKATNWAIGQRGLKPATKLVLWHLCDRHHRDHGCFPSQATLAEDCEMSRSGLNNHLAELEALGLIKRIRRSDKASRRQKSTFYIFAFEDHFEALKGGETDPSETPKPCPDSGHGSVSKKTPKPCPKKRDSRVQTLDTNPVREPGRNPRATCARRFFTDQERMTAREIADHIRQGGTLIPERIPTRIRTCLIAEKMISEADAEKHKLGAEEA